FALRCPSFPRGAWERGLTRPPALWHHPRSQEVCPERQGGRIVPPTTVETPPAGERPGHSLPASLGACLPLLWSRVLFPGRARACTQLRWTALVLLIVIPGVLLYPCLSFHLFEPDEGRYAQIPREMVGRGEWIVPYLQGQPYLDKPPLLYWMVIVCYHF